MEGYLLLEDESPPEGSHGVMCPSPVQWLPNCTEMMGHFSPPWHCELPGGMDHDLSSNPLLSWVPGTHTTDAQDQFMELMN